MTSRSWGRGLSAIKRLGRERQRDACLFDGPTYKLSQLARNVRARYRWHTKETNGRRGEDATERRAQQREAKRENRSVLQAERRGRKKKGIIWRKTTGRRASMGSPGLLEISHPSFSRLPLVFQPLRPLIMPGLNGWTRRGIFGTRRRSRWFTPLS